MKAVIHNMIPTKGQSFMPYFRSYMVRELLRGKPFPEVEASANSERSIVIDEGDDSESEK
jgi:hypothetical protein